MFLKIRTLLVPVGALALVWLAGARPAQAQQQIVLDIPGVQGESTLIGYENQIIVLNASLVAANPACAKSGLTVSEVSFTKRADKASVDLYTAVRDRTVYPAITFRFLVSSDGGSSHVTYQKYDLTNAIFSSSAAAGSSGDTKNVESWTVSFSQIVVTYTFVDAGGKPGATETMTMVPSVCPGS